jgi:hypothetical protein
MKLAMLSQVRVRALPRSTTALTLRHLIHLAQMLPDYRARGGAPYAGHVMEVGCLVRGVSRLTMLYHIQVLFGTD